MAFLGVFGHQVSKTVEKVETFPSENQTSRPTLPVEALMQETNLSVPEKTHLDHRSKSVF